MALLKFLALFFFIQISATALADDGEATFDKYSQVSLQKLMLTGTISSTLPAAHHAEFYGDLGLNRFKVIQASDPNSGTVRQWCDMAVKDSQTERGETDGETGDAEVTLRAKLERCSQVMKHSIRVKHECKRQAINGKAGFSCTVNAQAIIERFGANQVGGTIKWTPYVQGEWAAGKGTIIKTSDGTASATIGKDKNASQAEAEAIGEAAVAAGLLLKRGLRDIKAFQLTSPVISNKGGYTKACLSKDVTELDTPFHILMPTSAGEVKKGFVKARKIYDGCTELPSHTEETKKSGRKYKYKPMAAQNILGSGEIKTGMTLHEMPSIGLNLGGIGGLSVVAGGELEPTGGVAAELNLAPYTGISEFHAFSHSRITLVGALGDTDGLQTILSSTGLPLTVSTAALAVQLEMGVLRRLYWGPLFAEGGVGAAGSYYLIDQIGTYTVGVYDYGAAVQAGIGLQLSPRFLAKLDFGYRFTIPGVTASNSSGAEIEIKMTELLPIHGFMSFITIHHNL